MSTESLGAFIRRTFSRGACDTHLHTPTWTFQPTLYAPIRVLVCGECGEFLDPRETQQNADGTWTLALPMRRATWLEVILDRWIGPRYGSPWRCVVRGICGR